MSDDLISRDAAKALFVRMQLKSLWSPQDVHFSTLDVVDNLDAVPAVEPKQWVPASDRLPAKWERAILRYSNGKISGGTYIGSRVFDVDFCDTDPAVSVVEWKPE